jgi:hypothetical protein
LDDIEAIKVMMSNEQSYALSPKFYLLTRRDGQEYMPHPSMPAIKTLGVDSVQLPHTPGEITFWGFDQQMIVVVHQTIGMNGPVEVSNNL